MQPSDVIAQTPNSNACVPRAFVKSPALTTIASLQQAASFLVNGTSPVSPYAGLNVQIQGVITSLNTPVLSFPDYLAEAGARDKLSGRAFGFPHRSPHILRDRGQLLYF